MAKKKTLQTKSVKDKMKELRESLPVKPEPTKSEGDSSTETAMLKWEQTDNSVRVSGYVIVTAGSAVFDLPVEGITKGSGIARTVSNDIFRIAYDNGIVYNKVAGEDMVDGVTLFINFSYEVGVTA